MMSMLFRWKNGDLFKPREHKPIITELDHLKHYTKTNYRKLDVILDYYHMSEADLITIYKMLNNPYAQSEYNGIYRVSKMIRHSDTLVQLMVDDIITPDRHTKTEIWINNAPVDLYNTLWYFLRDKLFDNIPHDVQLENDSPYMLEFARYTGNISIISMENSEDKCVDVNTLTNAIKTNLTLPMNITYGDERLANITTNIKRYVVRDDGDWLLVIPNDNQDQATIYVPHLNTDHSSWEQYIGRRA